MTVEKCTICTHYPYKIKITSTHTRVEIKHPIYKNIETYSEAQMNKDKRILGKFSIDEAKSLLTTKQ